MITGIYCIENLVNKKKYIGKANDIDLRKKYHITRLKNNKHNNCHLQKAWNKYKEDNFYFYILEECKLEDLNKKETHWILKLKTSKENFGYNLTNGGDGASTGEKNPQFNKGLPKHLVGKGFKKGEDFFNFGKKACNAKYSKFFGVSKDGKQWRVRIRINGKQIRIGNFKTELEAAIRYNKFLIENKLKNPLNVI